jgi:hypothetical protein
MTVHQKEIDGRTFYNYIAIIGTARRFKPASAIQEAVMKEKRKLKRRHLIYYLHVLERSSGEHVGYLVDITTNGIMIMSENPAEPGTVLELKIMLSSEMSSKQYLDFDVKTIYCEKSINETTYDIGCELLHLSAEAFHGIEMIIDELGFRD